VVPAFGRWRDRHRVALVAQPPGDLGARMDAALRAALERGERALLVGTDCPALDLAHLARAADALAHCDAVVGPAEDGGYVLIGLARPLDLFTAIEWGTPTVLAATRARLAATGARWHELPTLWDVDGPADLARWQAQREAPRLPAVA
jgi:uncharacterized protein